MPFPTFISENPYFSGAANVLACVLGGVLIVFLGRLIYSPIHFAVESDGGLRAFFRQRLGAQMWPILFMGFGVLTFVILFGLGMVLFAIKLSPYREDQKVSDQDLINTYPFDRKV